MEISHLYAASFQRRMGSGRTKPCLFFCEDGSGNADIEYVVKLRTNVDGRETGLAAELIASLTATALGIATPEPAIIEIDPALAEIVPDQELAAAIKGSAGPNCGSKVLTGGYVTWPAGMTIKEPLTQLAADVFCFDALIQNPDRKPENPNILWRGDELYVIDHELSFSFIYLIAPEERPWQVSHFDFLKGHLFYRQLKGARVGFERFESAMKSLPGRISEIISDVPDEWKNANVQKIEDHFDKILTHADEFIDEVRRLLQ